MKLNERSIAMRYFTPDFPELSGNDSRDVPTDMENDPNADEEVIDQKTDGDYPEPVKEEREAKLAPDKLADSIAYAIDGSGPGPISSAPTGTGIITEGMPDADPDDEKETL